MKKRLVLSLSILVLMAWGVSAVGADNATKTSNDLALGPGAVRDTVSLTDEDPGFTIYFRPAVRFGTDDRTLFILDFLVPVYRGDKDIVFINTKFTPDTDDAWETNLGVGYRRLVLADKLVLGGNLFYDHRKTKYGSHFDQIGLGLEAMAELNGVGLSTRINYYQPLSKAKLGEDFGYVFYGSGIYTAGIEEPMTGFDYEAGVRIPWISDYVETWAYAGGYHFFGAHVPDVNGVSARIEAFPTAFLRLDFEFRNDSVNNDEYYGEVAFEVPFSIGNLVTGKNAFEGIGDMFAGSRTLKERMVEPVHRDVDIVVGTDYLSGLDAASGDGTLREGIIFVSDTGSDSTGDGSFENPYYSLAAAETAAGSLGISTIHVMRGDGTGIAGNDFDTIDGLTVWGAGATYWKYPYVSNLVGGYPVINSTLTMNSPGMTVFGLGFDTNNTSAITVGDAVAYAGFSIFGNRIDSTGRYGIYCYSDGDIGASDAFAYVTGNTITVDSASGSPVAGIYLLSNGGSVYASILNNRIDGVSGSNYAYGIYAVADGDFTGSISRNTITGIDAGFWGDGIMTRADNDFNGSIIGNTITGVSAGYWADGIATGSYSGDFSGSISGNTISNIHGDAWADGIFIDEYGGDFIGTISGNTISNVYNTSSYGAAGIWIREYASSGNLAGTIFGNTFVGINSLYAFGIGLENNGDTTTTSITGNVIEVTGTTEAYGLYADSAGSLGTASSPLVFTNNSGFINSAAAYMMYLDADDTSGSNVYIGPGMGGMGNNRFTTTGSWNGNYPSLGGPIYTNGSYVNP